MSESETVRTRFEHATPILTCVTRDGASIYLSEDSQGQTGTWVWLGVDDVAVLHDEYCRSGAEIMEPPKNFAWALEMKVKDVDGHVLRFGSDPLGA